MVSIMDMSIRDVKDAKRVAKALDSIGINGQIDALKGEIESLKSQISELERFRNSVMREKRLEAEGTKEKEPTAGEMIRRMFNEKAEEFYPNGKGNQ